MQIIDRNTCQRKKKLRLKITKEKDISNWQKRSITK